MVMNKSIALSLCAMLASLVVALPQAEARDPFQPALWSPKKVKKQEENPERNNTQSLHFPLTENALAAYILVGVALSKDQAFAVVKAPDKKDYFIKTGAALGNEGGTIQAISSDGISVNTHSTLVTIPVSNKIEVKTDEQDN